MKANELVRASELRRLGISATSITRAVKLGILRKISRGLYISADCMPDIHFNLAEVAILYPMHPICLNSALAYYDVTDLLPRKIWIAISASSWKPRMAAPSIDTVRFREPYYSEERVTHSINGVDVSMYSLEKTLADSFRNSRLVRRPVAIEALRNSIEQQKCTLRDILIVAKRYGAFNIMKPYVEALTTYA